jgi:Zn-dependent metalloprotease
MRMLSLAALTAIVSFTLFRPVSTIAQVVDGARQSGVLSVAATSPNELAAWDGVVSRMAASRELVVTQIRDDRTLPGRRHENLAQHYQGIPVHGGGLTRQLVGGTTVSVFGTIYTGIGVDPTPRLTADEAAALLRARSGGDLAAGGTPRLVILPRLRGGFALAYRATMSDERTYFVDAQSGTTLQSTSERREQGQVGVGTGAFGDRKKISTIRTGNVYLTEDQLRPPGIHTLDTQGSNAVLTRMLNGGVAFEFDYPTDTDNIWDDARVVDAHVHSGWTHDYFFRQHQWRGFDGFGGRLMTIVHRSLLNNAFFTPPPFGPGRGGAVVYGATAAGLSVTSLDVAAHEIMHGVTHFSVSRRTGDGLGHALFIDRLGPTSFALDGDVFPCGSTVMEYEDGNEYPFLCDDGRYVLVSNHPGTVNEAFSDVLGTAVEFFFHEAGAGPLRADYFIGEDVLGFGPVRALDVPSAITIGAVGGRRVPLPDHRNRLISFAVLLLEGTEENPVAVDLAPLFFVGETVFLSFGTDQGGLHWNSSVFSHAYFLAVEGGRNATSGMVVQGVGRQNRVQIDRAFFRAMTEMMPNTPSLQTAAQAVRQSAIDLFGAGSPPAPAVGEAMTAVGLIASP